MDKDYSVSPEARKIYKRKLFTRIAKLVFLLLLIFLTCIYFLLYVLYSKGNFTVTLDQNAQNQKNVFLSEDGSANNIRVKLSAKSLDYMDNISEKWIRADIDTEADGSHNGDNYIAYSFYLLNYGNETVNYWYEVNVNDSIKGADEAIRIRIYRNGEMQTYAKKNKATRDPELNTKAFYSDDTALLEVVKDFAPGDKDRFTVVIWLEGDDPDCIDDIIGGEVKLEMNITEEHLDKKE